MSPKGPGNKSRFGRTVKTDAAYCVVVCSSRILVGLKVLLSAVAVLVPPVTDGECSRSTIFTSQKNAV